MSGLLDLARGLLERAWEGSEGIWPRATALLTRQALEGSVEQFFERKAPGVERTSARAQFICLRAYVGQELAHEAAQLWAELSRAVHVHAYELAPTGAELQRWIARASDVEMRLRAT